MAPKEDKNSKAKRAHHAKEILGEDQVVTEKNNVDGGESSDVVSWLPHLWQSSSNWEVTRLPKSLFMLRTFRICLPLRLLRRLLINALTVKVGFGTCWDE